MPMLNVDDALYRHLMAQAEAQNTSVDAYLARMTGALPPVPSGSVKGNSVHRPASFALNAWQFSTDYAFALQISPEQEITVNWIMGAFEYVTGFEPETVQPFADFMRVIHPRDREVFESSIQRALAAGQDISLNYRILTREGAIRYIDGLLRPQPAGPANFVLGVAHDVTDRVEVEQHLQMRLRQQAALADLSQQALAVTDLQALLDLTVAVVAETLSVDFVNVCHLLPDGTTLLLEAGVGWWPDEIGQRRFDLYDETDQNCMLRKSEENTGLCQRARICSLGLLRDYDIQSGISVIIPDNDGVFGVLGAHTPHQRTFTQDDINFLQSIANLLANYLARAATQDALRRSEEQFRKLLESASEGILLVDQTGRITLINHIAQEIFGYTRSELDGQSVNTLLPPALRATHDDYVADYLAAPTVRPMGQGRELFGQRKDGSTFPIEVSLSYVEIDNSRLVICFVVDITERRQLEQQRLDTARMMLELEKERELLNLKEQFMSMISHEFRSPLAAISASCQIIEHYYARLDHEQMLVRIGNISSKASQMTEMIDDVLTLTRAGVNMLEYNAAPLDLAEFCRDMVTNVQLTDPGHHDFQIEVAEGLGTVQADVRLLGHIFSNLLGNAAKYSPSGSTILFSVVDDGGDLRFVVRDEGIGIPVEDQKRLFKPFFRASNVGAINGNGLGLAVVLACVEAHGGSLRVVSAAGSGTTFTIYLPYASA